MSTDFLDAKGLQGFQPYPLERYLAFGKFWEDYLEDRAPGLIKWLITHGDPKFPKDRVV